MDIMKQAIDYSYLHVNRLFFILIKTSDKVI